ncbi:hypothetical protein DL96DRAFT_1706918 [Flagelloscypha sp. PMI_526]|nr:hypothetical protein DL96DRAFT_1706918 [Flagelloscypha sp. PMI_526]
MRERHKLLTSTSTFSSPTEDIAKSDEKLLDSGQMLCGTHVRCNNSPSNERNDDNNLVKSLKKNRRNWAKGTKKEILQLYIEAFADTRAISLRRAWDVIRMAEAHYNSLYPYDCGDDYEPPRPLLQFNPDSLPMPAHLSEEESVKRAAVYTACGNSIYCWIAYRAGLVVRSFSFGKGYERQMNSILQLLVKLSGVKMLGIALPIASSLFLSPLSFLTFANQFLSLVLSPKPCLPSFPLTFPYGLPLRFTPDIFLDLLQGLSTPPLAVFLAPSIIFPLGLHCYTTEDMARMRLPSSGAVDASMHTGASFKLVKAAFQAGEQVGSDVDDDEDNLEEQLVSRQPFHTVEIDDNDDDEDGAGTNKQAKSKKLAGPKKAAAKRTKTSVTPAQSHSKAKRKARASEDSGEDERLPTKRPHVNLDEINSDNENPAPLLFPP